MRNGAASAEVIHAIRTAIPYKLARIYPTDPCTSRFTSAYVSIRQHTSAYVSIRQHTSAYVSIRQHTSAYVSIRQHT
jgi:hypothetical protein